MGRGSSELKTYTPAIGGFRSSALPIFVLIVGIVIALGVSRPAVAGVILDEPILGGSLLVATDGPVTATFLGSDAGYFNTLYLDLGELGPDHYDVQIFDKLSPLNGEFIFEGSFIAGTELIFRLDVSNTGKSFFTGDLLRNPDLLAHAEAITTFDEESGKYVTRVGFEDLLDGGDLDFNDFEFLLTNVVDPAPPVPAPTVLALLGLGLAGIGYRRRKQIKAA